MKCVIERSGAAMHEVKIAEYRAEAAVCIARANLNSNKSTAARWLEVAAEWTRMVDELERNESLRK